MKFLHRIAAASVNAGLPATALAWEHIGHVWMPDDQPITYVVSEVGEDSIEDDGYEEWMSQEAYASWHTAQCAEFVSEYGGTMEDNPGAQTWDGQLSVTWDDPADEMATGVLAATFTWPGSIEAGESFSKNGRSYYRAEDSDIVFNNDVDFATDEAIENGQCNGETSMLGVMTHEVGHLLGMAHSCEENDICADSLLRDATMYWSGGPCETLQSNINDDDNDGITALYGPYATFQCSHELDPGNPDTIAQGNVPMDLKCIVQSEETEELQDASWTFGDGGSSTEFDPVHTYEEPGNYTIEACFTGVRDTCGEWEYCYRRIGYVRACGVPEPEFLIDHEDGMTYVLRNETDVSVYGCIYEIQWDIYKGSELIDSINAWEPTITFESEGEYQVVLNIGGPAGTGAAEATVDAYDHRGEGYGCSTVGGVGGLGGLALVLGALGMRRRRD